jgi:membrane protease YdiL (CAAX protease family)
MLVPMSRPARLAATVVLSVVAYVLLSAATSRLSWGHALAMSVAFVALPALVMVVLGGVRMALGRLDRWLPLSFAVYLPFMAWTLAYVPTDAAFFHDWAHIDGGASAMVARAAIVALGVAPVDFFCRAVVQRTSADEWGDRTGYAVATVAWMLGHVPELLWLPNVMGLPAGLAYIALAGLLGGYAYMRGGNVAGLMLGHATLNWVTIVAAAMWT